MKAIKEMPIEKELLYAFLSDLNRLKYDENEPFSNYWKIYLKLFNK